MSYVRSALTANQKRALRDPNSAEVMIIEMNRRIKTQEIEIDGLRDNLADMQNKFETSVQNYNKANTNLKVLQSRNDINVLIEIIKVICSVLLAGYGFYLLNGDNSKTWGIVIILVSILVYFLILIYQKKMAATNMDSNN